MTKKTVSTKIVTSEAITVHSEKVVNGIYVYRRECKTSVFQDGFGQHAQPVKVDQGLVDADALSKLERGAPPKEVKHLQDVLVFSDEDLEVFRTHQWGEAIRAAYRDAKGTFYDDFVEGKWGVDNLVYVERGSLLLKDGNGDILPIAQHVDYYSGLNTDDTRFHLEALVGHLRKRDDIAFDREDNPVESIPDYNRDGEAKWFVGFTWQPSKEDFRQVYERALEIEPGFISHALQQAMFETDILGLKAAGLNLYEDFYGEEPVGHSLSR